MRAIGIFPFILVACGQDVTTPPADCGVSHSADATSEGMDASSPSTDATVAADARPLEDAGGPPDAAGPLACHVDRFASCPDPMESRPNNTPADAISRSLMPSNGCQSGDSFATGADSFGGRVCQTEPADWFEYVYVPCDTLSFVAELRFRVTTPCERDAWTLTVTRRPCDGTDPNVSCTWEGEWRVVRALIEPSGSIGVFEFGVEHSANDTAFDYEWTLQIRR